VDSLWRAVGTITPGLQVIPIAGFINTAATTGDTSVTGRGTTTIAIIITGRNIITIIPMGDRPITLATTLVTRGTGIDTMVPIISLAHFPSRDLDSSLAHTAIGDIVAVSEAQDANTQRNNCAPIGFGQDEGGRKREPNPKSHGWFPAPSRTLHDRVSGAF
jgi:hypothetical protein